MSLLVHVKTGPKIIGYIIRDSSGRIGWVEEECIVAGSEELMRTYLRKMRMPSTPEVVIKEIRFSEILDNMAHGVTYAFDQESYSRFLPLAEMNEVKNLPSEDKFLEEPATGLDFLAINLT